MFETTLQNVILSLLFIIPGYIALKTKLVNINHSKTLSSILVYICSPGLIIGSFLKLDFSLINLVNMGWFMLITVFTQLVFMAILFFLFKKKHGDNRYKVLSIAAVCSNMGYFGMPIVNALFPNNPEVACYTSVYVITMNILLFTAGIYFLTGKKEYMSVKQAILNPATLSFFVGIILYVVGGKSFMPKVATDCINSLGNMCTPLSMIILGIRLASMNFKKIFGNILVYLVVAFKLIAFPLFSYLCVLFLPFDTVFKATMLILSAAPVASSVLNIAEMYGAEEEFSANVVMVSTLLSVITIPLLTLIL
ncbi:MAG: AEC family transporter [Clostridia bacterium]|nr:AEC family transporter [Clostridia bacterium]